MRLSQLARKLALRPSEVVTFLSAYQITLEEGLNARLTDEQVEKVVRYFAPDRLSEIKAEPVKEENKLEIQQEEPVLIAKEEQQEVVVPIIESVVASQITLEEEKTDVIKAPKVELAGLKVLGKIELPEAKKKATDQAGETEPSKEQARPRREDRRKQNDRPRQQPPRSYKNPVALEREQQEAEEKRKEKAKREKDKKAEYYYSRVKAGAQPKPVRSIMEEHAEEVKERRPAPKGLWGRFMNWLNG